MTALHAAKLHNSDVVNANSDMVNANSDVVNAMRLSSFCCSSGGFYFDVMLMSTRG